DAVKGVQGCGYEIESDEGNYPLAAELGHARYYLDWTKYLTREGGAYQTRIKGGGTMCGVQITRKEVLEILNSPVVEVTVCARDYSTTTQKTLASFDYK